MTLRLIGAGFGRTGTLSLKMALERLGFGACYHMIEVFAHPEHADVWLRANAGEAVDWDALFAGYQATVDWPGCSFWRELAAAYPDAKVLLNVRDAGAWYESFRATLFRLQELPEPDDPVARKVRAVGLEIAVPRDFAGAPGREPDGSREHIIGCFERHNAEVRAAFGADRLLEYEVREGWAPLCDFLGVAVPDEPFPRVNDRAFFQAVFGLDPE